MKNLKTIGLLAFAALALGACSKDDLTENEGTVTAETVEVPVSLTIQELTDAAADKKMSVASTEGNMDVQLVESAISTRTVDENAIKSLQVVQFQGDVVVGGYYTSSYEAAGVSCPLKTGTSTIYFIANLPQLAVNEGEALADFKNRSISNLPVYTNSDTANLPMVGVEENVNVDYSTSIGGTLNRIYAKLVLTVSKDAGLDSRFTPTVSVRNIPNNGRIDGTVPPAADPTTFFPTAGFQSKSIDGFAFGTPFTLYVPENLQGVASGISAVDKDGTGHSNGTYIEVTGVYPQGHYDITYKIYLGKDATEYNIKRNHQYTINATLRGDNITDKRVSGICNLSRKADGTESENGAEVGTNCYVVNKGALEYKFMPFKGKGGAKVTGDVTYSLLWSAYPASTTGQGVTDIIASVDPTVDSKGYVHFKTAGTWGMTREGNAVICAKDGSGNIVWSWHIWSTALDPNDSAYQLAFNTKNSKTYTVLSRLLGDVSGDSGHYNVALLYQWGRKDPFIPDNAEAENVVVAGVNFGGTTLTATDGTGWNAINVTTDAETSQTTCNTVDYAIKHPTTFIFSTDANNKYDWVLKGCEGTTGTNGNRDDLWGNTWEGDDTSTTGATVNSGIGSKSAYDPCPIGWRVAPQDAFTMFTQNGTNTTNSVEFNVSGSFHNGWDFYYQTWKDNATRFWPASGCRERDSGALSEAGAWGGSWSGSPFAAESQNASIFRFSAGDVSPVFNTNRAYGLPVRCVKE